MVTGIFGGSFDPPHLGHLDLARSVIKKNLADEIWFVPSFKHRFKKIVAAFEHRVKMLQLLIRNKNKMSICEIDRTLEEPGITLYLVEKLIKTYPQNSFCLVAGADIYFERDKWFKFDEIEKLVKIIYVERKGEKNPHGTLIPAPVGISSGELREKFREGREVKETDSKILKYVYTHGLYGTENK